MKKPLIIGLILTAVLAVATAAVGIVLVRQNDDSPSAASGDWTPPTPTGESAPDGLGEFYDQTLSWQSCDDAWCTTVKVPVDYAEPAGETTTLAVKVIPAAGEGGRVLFVNPGGPGGSAQDFAEQFAQLLGNDAQDVYDVVGVDPRGVGESSPLQCLDDQDFAAYIDSDPTPDDAAEAARYAELPTELGDACEQNSGALAAHVSTAEFARDLDVVRALMGQEKFDWFGASYGTYIGATYATLFPSKTGRMVLDGAIDPTLDAYESAMAQTTGFERALESYAKWCVTQDDCPLGDDWQVGIRKIDSLMGALDVRPLPAVGKRTLTEGTAFFGIALPLYNEGSWDFLSQALELAFKGDGTGLLYSSDQYFERQSDGSYASNGGQVITAVNCLDATDRPDQSTLPAELPRFEQASSVFGRGLAWGATTCATWPFTSEEPAPTITGAGAAPILVLGTTRDPATPYESAVALSKQLESGVLVTRDGDGHTAYTSGNACIAKTVDDFLVKGTVPKTDPKC